MARASFIIKAARTSRECLASAALAVPARHVSGIVLHPVGPDAERSELKRAFCSSLSEL